MNTPNGPVCCLCESGYHDQVWEITHIQQCGCPCHDRRILCALPVSDQVAREMRESEQRGMAPDSSLVSGSYSFNPETAKDIERYAR